MCADITTQNDKRHHPGDDRPFTCEKILQLGWLHDVEVAGCRPHSAACHIPNIRTRIGIAGPYGYFLIPKSNAAITVTRNLTGPGSAPSASVEFPSASSSSDCPIPAICIA